MWISSGTLLKIARFPGHLAGSFQEGRQPLGIWQSFPLAVKFVKAAASLLAQPLGIIERWEDGCLVDALWEGVMEVGAHMEANVRSHQVTQPAEHGQSACCCA